VDGASFGSAFRAVDLSANPVVLGEYLDRVGNVPAVRAAKRESFALLGAAQGDHLLDLGCGQGDDVRELGQIVGPAGRVVGIDKSAVLLDTARRCTPPGQRWVEFLCADANELPFAEASFDACRADRTVQHVPDADTALAELARVTKPGGTVVLGEMLNTLALPDDEPDPTARQVLARLWSEEERGGSIGLLLPLLLKKAGFIDIRLHRRRQRLTSFADVALLLQLPELCRAAVNDRTLHEANASGWLGRLERDFDAGRAALESQFLNVTAHKPWRRSGSTPR
jgi:ubiquinone/menaquinone biosynthesis C-methylase UbiE